MEDEYEERLNSSDYPGCSPSGTIFTFSGQGDSQSLAFTIGSSPWELMLWSNLGVGGSTSVHIQVVDPTQYDPGLRIAGVGGYGFEVGQGISIHEAVLHVPAGTYFLSVDTHYATTWTVWVVEF